MNEERDLHDDTWIVVADGGRARIMRSRRGERRLEPALDRDLVASHPHLRDMETDRPGRTNEGAGRRRSAMRGREDSRRHAERELARTVAGELERARQRGLRRIVLVAPARTLGDLREAMSSSVREIVAHELEKDLSQLPAHALVDRLGDALA
jgi:protein required for attachment to host cells